MKFETIIFEKKENYVLITLNRPDKLNALNKQMFDDLNTATAAIEMDSSIRAVIITGSGEKAFAAGADISELNACDNSTGRLFSEYGSKVMTRISALTIPVIAAVNGFALGGGCELAMACHIRFASEKAKMGQPEVNLGIIPGYGGTQRLTKLVGYAKSIELTISGNIINAQEALSIGLVNQVFAPEELMEKTLAYLNVVLSKSSIAIAAAIDTINNYLNLSELEGLQYETKIFGQVCGSQDFKEGTSAFLEKRTAIFTGK